MGIITIMNTITTSNIIRAIDRTSQAIRRLLSQVQATPLPSLHPTMTETIIILHRTQRTMSIQPVQGAGPLDPPMHSAHPSQVSNNSASSTCRWWRKCGYRWVDCKTNLRKARKHFIAWQYPTLPELTAGKAAGFL